MMKTLLRSIDMAFSMFSVIPMPIVEWKQENMKYMLCSLPLVGAVIGGCLYLWYLISGVLGFSQLLTAAGYTLIPVAISGGIHLDGFCDTVDAVSSHASPERKREILKDSHAGAFAIIWLCFYMIAYFALAGEAAGIVAGGTSEKAGSMGGNVILLVLIPMLSRAAGAFAGTAFPSSGKEGLLKSFRDGASKKAAVILIIWCVLLLVAMAFISPLCGALSAAAVVICAFSVRRMALREFGGMSGDIAGFLISVTELALLAALVLSEKLIA
ncbi:MAG: adenosylcobinamide-GDP ribazoletransferase [Lachnospiraceae bacterium]|nr:adenosylcobinamide-GDP ribazoletransferase [Lachnospiraceae bacterium]